MSRNPSKILSAVEAKVLDLDQQIANAAKVVATARKEMIKAEKAHDKLLVRRDKAAAKKKPKATLPLDEPIHPNREVA